MRNGGITIFVGDECAIYMDRRNGGDTTLDGTVNLKLNADLNGIKFYDNKFIIFGDNNLIMYSKNNGSNWYNLQYFKNIGNVKNAILHSSLVIFVTSNGNICNTPLTLFV